MAILCGLDMREIQWQKLKGSSMFSKTYHLRRAKVISYQLATLFFIAVNGVNTQLLKDFVSQKKAIQSSNSQAKVHNSDFIGIASFGIVAGMIISMVFGLALFVDLFWPERRESKGVSLAWKASAIISAVLGTADSIALTTIVLRGHVSITGVPPGTAKILFGQNPKVNQIYKLNNYCIAAVVLVWLGFITTISSTVILLLSYRHESRNGRKALQTDQTEEISETKNTII